MKSIRSIVFSRFAFVVAIFFFMAAGGIYFMTQKMIAQFFLEDNARAVVFLVNNVRSNFEANLKALNHLATADGISPFEKRRAEQLLDQFLRFQNLYGSVHVYRADGTLLAAKRRADMVPYLIEQNFYQKWDRNFIEVATQSMARRQPMITRTFRGTSGRLYQVYFVPILGPSKPGAAGRGVLPARGAARILPRGVEPKVFGLLSGAIFYDFEKVHYLVEGLELGRDNFILLTDDRGNIVAQDGFNRPQQPLLIAPDIQQATDKFYDSSSPQRAVQMATVDIGEDSPYSIFSAPLADFRLTLTVGASQSAIRYKKSLFLNWLFVAMIVGLALSFFAAVFIAESISDPLHQIASAVDDIHDGKFSAEIAYAKNDELGQLCRQVNQIRKKINKGRFLGHLWSATIR